MSHKIEDMFSQDELEFAYGLIESKPMTSKSLSANVTEAKDDFTRSGKSLRLLAVRMHLAVHGDIPEGMSEDPSWYKVSSNIKDYVFGYGIDSHTNVAAACIKRGIKVKQLKKEEATKLFLSYCKQQFQSGTYKWNTLGVFREEIVRSICNGVPVANAVKQIVKH